VRSILYASLCLTGEFTDPISPDRYYLNGEDAFRLKLLLSKTTESEKNINHRRVSEIM
jgi:hypothetical protein